MDKLFSQMSVEERDIKINELYKLKRKYDDQIKELERLNRGYTKSQLHILRQQYVGRFFYTPQLGIMKSNPVWMKVMKVIDDTKALCLIVTKKSIELKNLDVFHVSSMYIFKIMSEHLNPLDTSKWEIEAEWKEIPKEEFESIFNKKIDEFQSFLKESENEN